MFHVFIVSFIDFVYSMFLHVKRKIVSEKTEIVLTEKDYSPFKRHLFKSINIISHFEITYIVSSIRHVNLLSHVAKKDAFWEERMQMESEVINHQHGCEVFKRFTQILFSVFFLDKLVLKSINILFIIQGLILNTSKYFSIYFASLRLMNKNTSIILKCFLEKQRKGRH